MDVLHERFERKLRRADARPCSLRGALAFPPVALVASVLGEDFLAGFGVAGGSRSGFFVLMTLVLRARRRNHENHSGGQQKARESKPSPKVPARLNPISAAIRK